MGVDAKRRYRTPGPGAYDVGKASRQCLKHAPCLSFGGSLNKVDRGKTGPLKVIGEKEFVPGPCSYAVEAENQARGLCERPQTLIFGKSSRDDLTKLFFGHEAVAYISSTTPGPGTYELRQQRPFSLYPTKQPGTTIGGPLANVDRVKTGPLAASYNSFTPGPGAYDDDDDRGIRLSPLRRSMRKRVGEGRGRQNKGASSCVSCDNDRASTSGSMKSETSAVACAGCIATNRESVSQGGRRTSVEDDIGGFSADSVTQSCRAASAARANDSTKGREVGFSLSPFLFVNQTGYENHWQFPFPARASQQPTRALFGGGRGNGRAKSDRSPQRSSTGSRKRGQRSKYQPEGTVLSSSLSLSTTGSQRSSPARPTTTFGSGSREQAGCVLAPGFKGCSARSTKGIPGPGAYRNVPGSLGHQVDSTLSTSIVSSFTQSDRLLNSRDSGVPGPGAYKIFSSLGCQVSSTRATAPVPAFGTSVRCALEDGLVG